MYSLDNKMHQVKRTILIISGLFVLFSCVGKLLHINTCATAECRGSEHFVLIKLLFIRICQFMLILAMFHVLLRALNMSMYTIFTSAGVLFTLITLITQDLLKDLCSGLVFLTTHKITLWDKVVLVQNGGSCPINVATEEFGTVTAIGLFFVTLQYRTSEENVRWGNISSIITQTLGD